MPKEKFGNPAESGGEQAMVLAQLRASVINWVSRLEVPAANLADHLGGLVDELAKQNLIGVDPHTAQKIGRAVMRGTVRESLEAVLGRNLNEAEDVRLEDLFDAKFTEVFKK